MFVCLAVATLFAVANAGFYGGGGHGGGGHGGEHQYQHLGSYVGKYQLPPKEIRITKTVAVKVPVPYPVKVPHSVPYPVHIVKHVPVPVPKIIKVHEQVPVEIPKPYPVPVYKHEAQQAEQSVQHYSTQQQNQQNQYNYFKESGKYTSPVFDISAFHPSVMSGGKGASYGSINHGAYQSYGQPQQAQQSYESQAQYGHQEASHGSFEQQVQDLQNQVNSGHQEQQQQQQYLPPYQYEQAGQSGGQSEGGKDEGYAAALQQIGQEQSHQQYSGQSNEGDAYPQYVPASTASSAGQEEYGQGYGQEQQQQQQGQEHQQHEVSQGYTDQGSVHQEQQTIEEYQPQIQQQQAHYEQAQTLQTPKLPASNTYSYFQLGGHTQQSGHFDHSSSRSLGLGGHQLQVEYQSQQQHQQPDYYQPQQVQQHQEVQSQYFHPEVQAQQSHNSAGHFQSNIGQSVLKEVQGPRFGQSIKSQTQGLYASHGHYKTQ